MILPLLAAVTPVPAGIDAQTQADIRCVVVLSAAVSNAPTEMLKAQVGAGMLYFLGRIDGRHPGLDLASAVSAAIKDQAALKDAFDKDRARCGEEMRQVSAKLVTVGGTVRAIAGAK